MTVSVIYCILIYRQGNHIHDLKSDIEFLKLEAQKKEDASQKAVNDAINENQKAEERIKQ